MSRKKSTSSLQWKNQIESTLQRIQRQSSSSLAQPPNAASAAIGKGLAQCLLNGIQDDPKQAKPVADEIVACLIHQDSNSCLSQSFFSTLESNPRAEFLQWIPTWILQAEEEKDSSPCLSCMISAYAQCCCELKQSTTSCIADTYNRLSLSSSRTCMQRDFVRLAPDTNLLTTFMACSVLNLLTPIDEKLLLLSSLWAKGWAIIKSNSDEQAMQYIQWMVDSLHLFLNGIPKETIEYQYMSMEVSHQWLSEICNMMSECQPCEEVGVFLSTIFDKILPHFFQWPCRFCMKDIIDTLCNGISRNPLCLDRAAWFRLGNMVLSTPVTADVDSLLTLTGTLTIPCNDNLVQGMLYSLICILASNDDYREAVDVIRKQLAEYKGRDKHKHGTDDLTSLVQLFRQNDVNDKSLLKFMTTPMDHVDPLQVSAFDQTFSLLLGCALLCSKTVENDELDVHSYLKALLQQFPHLGITLLPILFQSIQTACGNNDGLALLQQLEFLCDALVKDANCAQQVWNLVGVTMTQQDSPTSVRTVAIRVFPILCANNKKLYRRVIETLGTLVDSKQPEIRLAVAVAIDTLAREDRIRDVSDVIGWVQSFLSDEHSCVVHFAVSSLHHLVVAQELDFSLVVKVLNKRLCPISDIEALLELPETVLEALVLLLGDGECDEVDSDDDDEEVLPTKASQDLIGVSPQVSGAVDTLLQLANSDALSRDLSERTASFDTISRIRRNICMSLAGYSLHSLGLDDEGVQAAVANVKSETDHVPTVTDAGLRYMDFMQVISNEMQSPFSNSVAADLDPIVSLSRKILSLEEDALGASLWQKRGKKTASSKPDRTTAPKAAYSALPSFNQIEGLYDNPSFSTSVASLFCYAGNSIEDLFDNASEFTEGLQDPVSFAFSLQAWLHAMGTIWNGSILSSDDSKSEAAATVVEEVRSWKDLLDNSDISYLVLAVFSIYVPDMIEGQDGGSNVYFTEIVEGIRDDVLAASEGHQFESLDMADLCVGIVTARAVQSRATAFVNNSIDALEQSLREHSGQASFGASYGLALIAQAAAEVAEEGEAAISNGPAQQRSWILQILSLLVSEMQSCLVETSPVLVALVACLKTGKPTPDLLDSLSSMTTELKVHEATEPKARSLLLSLALCMRAAGIVSPELLLCLHKYIEELPWGIDKGFAVSSAAIQCVSMGMLSQKEAGVAIESLEAMLKDLFEEGEMKRFSDALYAYVTLKTSLSSSEIDTSTFELVEDLIRSKGADASDELKSSLLLCATVLLSTFPCLANGGRMFCSNVDLHPKAKKDQVLRITSLLAGTVKASAGPKSTGRAIQSLGLLAAAKHGPSKNSPSSVFRKSTESSADRSVRKPTKNQVSLDFLPSPHDGTVLEALLAYIKQSWGLVVADSQSSVDTSNLVRLLSCLEPLSLPSEFVRSFIQPMLATDIEALKSGCVELLVSQVSGRRRAAFDGRDFVQFVNRLALLPVESFLAMVGKGSGPAIFMSSLHAFLPKLPSDNVEAILLSLWTIGEAEFKTRGSTACALGYLDSISLLLQTREKKESLRLSPRTYTTIVQVLLRPVFSTLASSRSENLVIMHTLEQSFVGCLTNLDVSVLDESEFFAFGGNAEREATDLMRAFCITGLVQRQYFEQDGRSSKQLLKVVAWFANLRGAPNIQDPCDPRLRELAFRIAIATKAENADSKKEILSLLFEALHIHGPGMRLELLGMLASVWSNGLECDPESSSLEPFFNAADQESILPPATILEFSELLAKDMPFNMGSFGRSIKVQGLIGNSVLRIVKTWSEQGVSHRELSSLEGVLVCCRTLESGKEQDLSTFMISQLTSPSDRN